MLRSVSTTVSLPPPPVSVLLPPPPVSRSLLELPIRVLCLKRPSSVMLPDTTTEPVRAPEAVLAPALTRPRSAPASEPLTAAICSVPVPTLESVRMKRVALLSMLSDRLGLASAKAARRPCTVTALLRSMPTWVPSRNVTNTSLLMSEMLLLPVRVDPWPVPLGLTLLPLGVLAEPTPRIPKSLAAWELFKAYTVI